MPFDNDDDKVVDISLCDDDELLDEVGRRGLGAEADDFDLDLDSVLAWLRKQGCPPALLDQLDDWASVPVATPERLKAWLGWIAWSQAHQEPVTTGGDHEVD